MNHESDSPKRSSEAVPHISKEPIKRRMPARRNGPQEDARNRRLAILLAAEKLFGERGYHSVSIRDIAKEADVPLALVGYYYGAKHELYRSIFESWQDNIDQRRQRLRAAVKEGAAESALERVLAAFIEPLVALHSDAEGRHYAQMAVRDLAAPTPESDAVWREFFDDMAHEFIDTLNALFPSRTRGDVAWCYQFMLGATLHFLSDQRVARLSRGENGPADPARQGTLLTFVVAGFRGVLGPATLPATANSAASARL